MIFRDSKSKIGIIGQGARRKAKPALRFTKKFGLAINELKNDLSVVETNAPINEKEGNTKQAKLERSVAKSIRAAITELKK